MTATRDTIEAITARVGDTAVLDGPGKLIGKAVRGAVGPGKLKDLLSGTPIGHALHPLLTDVVIGTWTSALLLDLFGGRGSDRAARRLIAIGIAAYPPTALTGVSDWADTEISDEDVRRIGLVHAVSNSTALACYIASLSARRHGRRGRGIGLALAGAGAMAVGGHLGGHLTLRLGVGVDQTAFDSGPEEWTDALAADELSGTEPVSVQVGETPVMLVSDGEQVLALNDRCSHRGCSLASGEIEGGAVVCPCHGSRFDLRSGAVLQGPATAPQPVFKTRTREGRIEVRPA